MNDQTIPAEKVRELAAKYSGDVPTDPHFLLGEIKADLRALLPTPPQPTSGLLGRWAKHPKYGDVVVISDRTDKQGDVWVSYIADSEPDGMDCNQVRIDSLTFPHQTTRPVHVPAGEAWLVNIHLGDVFRQNQVALKCTENGWISFTGGTLRYWLEEDITLVAPLTPERPGTDLQARYDELDKSWCHLDGKYSTLREDYDALEAKYREAQEKIKTLEQPSPAWRIEHDHKNLRVGDYIIDKDDDYGTVENIAETGTRYTDANALGKPQHAPFIVFPSKDAATTEAIAEAKKARDKEMEK